MYFYSYSNFTGQDTTFDQEYMTDFSGLVKPAEKYLPGERLEQSISVSDGMSRGLEITGREEKSGQVDRTTGGEANWNIRLRRRVD